MNTLQRRLVPLQEKANAALDRFLPAEEKAPTRLHQAMRYAALAPGKRIRPVLAYATGEALGVQLATLDPAAVAVECIHAYSLIHDDLPAMDDDELRRGRPTCHRQFGEATAILAGDALQALAFEVLSSKASNGVSNERRLTMTNTLARASGSLGMAGGQALDLAAVGNNLTLGELENVHKHKTGALIQASVMLGYLGGNGHDDDLAERLKRYATCVGLAFQVQDDILDVEGDTETIGKPQGSDAGLDKPTYPHLLGMDNAKATANRLCEEAIACLEPLGSSAETLAMIADYIVKRDR
ncbi:MAG: farnesyl diphosphate synthase [Pseudomonadota bacterium]|nr:farnesyl diphosphate synthase [Pseudomonadota bacterium]